MMTDEAASVNSTVPTSEQIGFQLESTSEPVSTPATSSIPTATGLKVISSPDFPKLVVELNPMITSPTSLVASMLVSMKTSIDCYLFSVALTAVPMMPSTIVTTKLIETPPSKLTHHLE